MNIDMNSKFSRLCTFLLFLCGYLLIILSSCSRQKECYDGVIEKGGLKEISSFKRTVCGDQYMAVTDSSIIIADNDGVECYGYDGVSKSKTAIKDISKVHSFDIDSDGYWFYTFSCKNTVIHTTFNGDTLLTTDKVTTLNNIGYLGDGKLLVPEMVGDSLYCLNVVDAKSGESTPAFDLLKSLGYDVSDPFGGSFSVASRFGQRIDGKTLFYCFFNSKFVVIEGDSVFRMGEDYRHLPVAKTIMMGHNHLLDPMNCGILAGCADSTGVYLVTPKFKSRRWCESGEERNIDVYDPQTFEYKGSWELPVSKGRYIKSISKCGGKLFVLYISNNEGAEIKILEFNNL